MSIIKILPENLVNQIAAGEVVERPASVAKELLENSIDAGADRITLEITGSGDEMIRITDNGYGMNHEDAKLAFERHATSKIAETDDLFQISTMGFRGEAIASIASVSHVTLQTKLKGNDVGTKVICVGGKIEKHEECSCPEGTSIEVRNLFYNTPARKKYLKTPSTEYQHILNDFQATALTYPGVHFKLVHNEKASFEYPKTNELVDRVHTVLGKNTADACIPIFYGGTEISIEGFIGKPELARKGSKHQYLFVNNRHISHPLFSYALSQSYHSLLMDGKKPFYVINIRIDPKLIDVNVHPRKLEIRFLNQSKLFRILQSAAKVSLEKNVLMPEIPSKLGVPGKYDLPGTVNQALEFTEQISSSNVRDLTPGRLNKYAYKQDGLSQLSMTPLTQIAKSYILAENEEGLVLIDQHAAHERIRFEELMDEYEKKEPAKQQLLIPQNIELSPLEVEIFSDNKEIFNKLGFEIEVFGGNTFIIHSIPAPIAKENIENVILNVLNDVADKKKTHEVKNPQERIIEYMACRSAIKFGKDLSLDEMMSLIRQLDKLKRPYTCPHGRPSMIKLTFHELEKMFKRK
jgi:DNA mismatch repair protein MutL